MSEVRELVTGLCNAIKNNKVYVSRDEDVCMYTLLGMDKGIQREYHYYPALLFGGGVIRTKYDEFVLKLNRKEGKLLKRAMKEQLAKDESEHKKYIDNSLLSFCNRTKE